MARGSKSAQRRSRRSRRTSTPRHKTKKTKTLKARPARKSPREVADPAVRQQFRQYEEAMRYFNQQKLHKAKQALEKVAAGPSHELADRARVHLRICEQRISRPPTSVLRGAEDYYHQGVAMMNLGLWDSAREHLEKARKLAPKADYVYYALAALDCLTGEADLAMENLKTAIDLRPENRYHARNDEDFAFLQDDPRFTEMLYPEREGFGN
jgi:tetratricopeptide (TPR) repeat protein